MFSSSGQSEKLSRGVFCQIDKMAVKNKLCSFSKTKDFFGKMFLFRKRSVKCRSQLVHLKKNIRYKKTKDFLKKLVFRLAKTEDFFKKHAKIFGSSNV